MTRFVIVGNGLAGHRAAIELRRQAGTGAQIALIGSEDGLPYDRPPLSKEFLLGRMEAPELVLKDAGAYAEFGIDYVPRTMVTAIDPAGHSVMTADRRSFGYDRLLLATGSRPRRLAAAEGVEGVHYLRTLADAGRLRDALRARGRLVVIGGGFIGLEVAAAARGHGCEVTVIEAQERLLSRGMPVPAARSVQELHLRHGVDFVLGAGTASISGGANGTAIVTLPGRSIAADALLVGIGVIPNTALAEAARLAVSDGIVVDAQCRTSDPDIFAAGEVTAHPSTGGQRRRIESWKLASEQPLIAARAMAGVPAAFSEPPWLWSDQYGANIQLLGAPDGASSYRLAGRLDSDRWTLVSLDAAGRPIGAVAMNNGRDISMLKRAVRDGGELPRTLADATEPMALDPAARQAPQQDSTLAASGP